MFIFKCCYSQVGFRSASNVDEGNVGIGVRKEYGRKDGRRQRYESIKKKKKGNK
jgi:hypothetical protein